jgi:D-arabinose 1-dehydrogenase-like Zn-dependent alcohol dehydrogenase
VIAVSRISSPGHPFVLLALALLCFSDGYTLTDMASFTVYKGSPDGTIVRSQTTRPPLLDDQVFIEVTASGLCSTDEHYKATDMALGYQGVGIVKGVGPNVKDFKEDHRVGWGYQHAACGHCNSYLTGRESYCPQRVIYGEASLDQGSFAQGSQ